VYIINLLHFIQRCVYNIILLSYEFSAMVKDIKSLILCLFSWISHYNQLSMQAQVATVYWSCFPQLRQLHVVQRSLTKDVLQSLVQAFVHCHLDYCNAILTKAADGQIRLDDPRLSSAAGLLVSGARCRDRVLPILCSLHWLPVWRRVTFTYVVIAWKCASRRTWRTTVW